MSAFSRVLGRLGTIARRSHAAHKHPLASRRVRRLCCRVQRLEQLEERTLLSVSAALNELGTFAGRPRQAFAVDADPAPDVSDLPAQLGWETIHSETFEGAFPSGDWQVWCPTGGGTWDETTYSAHNGSYSAYCVETSDSAPGPYPNNTQAWTWYGPFSLADATDAKVDFWYRNKSQAGYDFFGWYASINDLNYYGYQISGDQDSWRSQTFDLTDVYTLGDLTGQPEVWIAFIFDSDSAINDKGAFVDDVVISKYVDPFPNLTPHQPSGWSDKIVASRQPGTNTDDTLCTADSIYVDWSVINDGGTATGSTFYTELYVDGGLEYTWSRSTALNPGSTETIEDYSIGSLGAGPHTLTIRTDSTPWPNGAVSESNETDNEYTKDFTVYELGSIQGSTWHDQDGDGEWDTPSEPGLEGWKVYVDVDGNGQWDEDGGPGGTEEPYSITASDGSYSIENMKDGTWIVREELLDGWTQTYPATAAGSSMAATASGDSSTGFSWSGWSAEAGPSGLQTATFDYTFEGTPNVDGSSGSITVSLAGEDSWTEPGDPALPVRFSTILLPQGSEIVSVDVELGPGQVISRGSNVAAVPDLVPMGKPVGAAYEDLEKTVRTSFPEAPGIVYSTHTLCGYSIGSLAVFPVHYDVRGKTVRYYPSMSVTVKAAPNGFGEAIAVRAVDADAERVGSLVENPSAVLTYDVDTAGPAPMGGTLPSGGPYDYVVVTSGTLESSFQPLVNQKISKGLTAGIVTTDYIYANFTGTEGGDNPDKIRDFIREAYTTWGTQWVLLGGDTDVVPHRGAYGYVMTGSGPEIDNNIPTDIYFACLDGPWNNDSDSIWGESNDGSGGGDVDLTPEVYIGRAPVSNTTEATNFVNKTVAYETTPHPNLYTGVWLGEQLDGSTWGGYHKEIIKDNQVPPTWTLTERYEKDAAWSGADFIGDLNASPHIVNHDGHANEYGNAKLSRTDVDNLTNSHPYVMYSIGCYSGAFDFSDCIAEHHVKGANGAVAVVMNSRYGWYWPGNNSDAPSFRYDRDFWDAVFNEGKDQFGEAQHDSKIENLGSVGSTGAYRWLHFCITLFGDPETSLAQAPSGAHVVQLDPGEDETGVNFGNEDDVAPRVANVWVRGSSWAQSFLDYLAASGVGHATHGYPIPDGASEQLLPLPWFDINVITIGFNERVDVEKADLSLRGVTVTDYAFAADPDGFSYDDVDYVATWTLHPDQKIEDPDKLLIDLSGETGGVTDQAGNLLDGEWPGSEPGFPSGNGTPGGDFQFRFNVLPGDADQNAEVLNADWGRIRAALFEEAGDSGYSIFYDVDGSGEILNADWGLARSRMFDELPEGEPTPASAPAMGGTPTGFAIDGPGGRPILDWGPVRLDPIQDRVNPTIWDEALLMVATEDLDADDEEVEELPATLMPAFLFGLGRR